MKIADCISRISSEGLPLLKVVLNKLAPGEFENVQQSSVSLKIQIPTNFPNKLGTALTRKNMYQKDLAEKLGDESCFIFNDEVNSVKAVESFEQDGKYNLHVKRPYNKNKMK